jgi:pimeloyl-ACP methyl ester carboxylesterase
MWFLCSVAVLSVPAQVFAQPAAAAGCPAVGTRDTSWIGMRLLQGGKGYAQTPMGEVHYRLVGTGQGPVMLLIHQTPWSMIEFAEIQACLAARGVRSLAVDTPGYGMSDAPEGQPSIAQYADNLLPVLDSLHIRKVVLAGHHTGSAIAAAFAARHPERTLGVILHGTPLYTPEERAKRLGAPQRPRTLKDDGSHLSDYYKYIRAYAGPNPRTKVTAMWSVFDWYQAGINDIAHDTVFRNDMAADLDRVRAPALILSDAKDSLHANDQRAATLYPRFRYLQFSDDGAHALMIDPARWAQVAADFLAQIDKPGDADRR